jgi:hypothetical protein
MLSPLMRVARASWTAATLAVVVLALSACGGGAKSKSSTVGRADVPEATVRAVTDGDVTIFSSINATRNLVAHPRDVTRAEQLLKPLVVAKTLGVNQSNPTAGGLTQNLLDELDNTVPGLTRENANGDEEIDTVTVNRFLRYGRTRPATVFHDRAARGVATLEGALRGLPRTARVAEAPVESAQTVVANDVRDTRPYWPDLSRRLEALQASLR